MSPYFGASQTNSFITFFPALLILDISEADFSGADSFYPVVATMVSTLAIALIIFVGKLFFNTSADLFTSIFRAESDTTLMYSSRCRNRCLAARGGAVRFLRGVHDHSDQHHERVGDEPLRHRQQEKPERRAAGAHENPLIIGALFGVLMNLCNLHITGALKQLFVYLSNAATPLSLMSVGAGLIVSMHIRKLVSISYATVLKLVAMPLITIALVHYFGATGVPASIAILYSAVPCAGNAYILARQMGAIMKRWPPLSPGRRCCR